MTQRLIRISSVAVFCLSLYWVIQFVGEPTSKYKQDEKKEPTGALQALDFWTRSRAYPDNDIPADKYYTAYTAAKQNLKERSRLPEGATIWEPIGPIDFGSRGRAISVAVNPLNSNTIYCGTASGGLWRSYTSGLGGDWKRVTLGYPALGISAISVDPADSNAIYIGTGEVYRYGGALGGLVVRTTRGSYGIGILKTTNNGVTWTKSLDWTYNQQRGVQQIRINPQNHNTIFAATSEGIYRSFDKGATWTHVLSVLMAEDIVIHSEDTTLLLATCGNFKSPGYGVYRSFDAGTNWSRASGSVSEYSGKALLAIVPSNPDIVYASIADSTTGAGGLWRTFNFGSVWTKIDSSGIFGVQGWYSHFVAVHATDPNQIVHAGLSIEKSTNGGVTFFGSSGYYSDNHNYAQDPQNPDYLYIVDDNGIYRSTNFGASFIDIGYGMQTLQFYNGFSCSATDSELAMGQSQDHIPGYIFRGSLSWDRGASDEAGWTAIDQTNDYTMYAVSRNGGSISKSTSRGYSFFNSGGFIQGAWNSPVAVSLSNPNVLYLGTLYIYRSTNAAGSWLATNNGLQLDGNTALSMAISGTHPDTVFVGMAPFVTRSHIYRTTNGGTSWTNITGTLPDRYPLDLAVNPVNAKTVYLTLGGFSAGHVFKSTDLGSTWTDISGTLPDAPTGAVLVDPVDTNTVYVGNDIGVYISTDGGTTWSDYSAGLPEAVLTADLSLNLSARILRIATHGNGVYQRKVGNVEPPPTFDYRVVAFQSPSDRGGVLVGSTLTSFSVLFRNVGATSQADSFSVKYHILRGSTEVFSQIKTIPGLDYFETRLVTFNGNVTLPDTGSYTMQAFLVAADQNPANDTLIGSFTVFPLPSITFASVTKGGCTYAEISGGSPGPAGDDNQKSLSLPFTFMYDGHQYDSLQISTNGWAEFGTGANSSLYGLSSSGQVGAIGANDNGRLGSFARPSKTVGPWWEDMNTDIAGAAITYTTLGSAPTRVFIVQWKNMRAYYDPGTTAQVNFQLRLYETSNLIEFHYGPVIGGAFDGDGAMLGFKDHIGGDYHYFDIAAGGTGTAGQVTTNLYPFTEWPGPDSCIQIQTNATTTFVSHATGWNMLSIPATLINYSLNGLGISQGSYQYEGGAYQRKDTLLPGKGGWIKFPSAGYQYITGSALPSVTVHLVPGWNMIGSVDHEVVAPSGGIVTSKAFGYSQGYQITSTLKPGKGYWVRSSGTDDITLGPVAYTKNEGLDFYNSITIIDKQGRTQTLYIAVDMNRTIDASMYELPPAAVEGFDVRFSSQRMLEVVADKNSHEFPISITSAECPLTIQWNFSASLRASLNAGKDEIVMSSTGSTSIRPACGTGRHPSSNLKIKISSSGDVPTQFSLAQNYPNPFNPTTVIRYELPMSGRVTLKVYDILGREVKILVDEEQQQGKYQVQFDGEGLASGVYFYKLTAGNFTNIRKMLLAK